VDTLDFPIDPPDASTVSRGGEDFGVFRSRYDKFHAGEDWGGPAGQPNLGTPVYSIGHGLVTYAEPEGWNRDKGVVIVQHTFADGHSFYSFYGHLDPPSVVLQPGDCVTRGEQVGNIGKPRTSPHLHFEIRTHMPYIPGPGYWPEDPTTAGWLPPSATIWQERLAAAPGVQWVRSEASQLIGQIDEQTLVVLAKGELLGLNQANGRVRWRYTLADESRLEAAALDVVQPLMYLANQFGHITAVSPPDTQLIFTPRWEVDVGTTGLPTLLPLPGGGVLLLVRQWLIAISDEGTELWRAELPARPFRWATTPGLLAITTDNETAGLWTIDQDGLTPWQTPGGLPAINNGNVWVYTASGLYQLNQQTGAADWLLSLSAGFLHDGAITALPDGGVLLVHTDLFDRRLIALSGDGSLRWERSLREIGAGDVALVVNNGRVYLLTQTANNTSAVTIFAVDLEGPHLERLFVGGSRTPRPAETWVAPGEDWLLVNIGGGHLVAWQPLTAQDIIESSP